MNTENKEIEDRKKIGYALKETSLNRIRKHGEEGLIIISTNRSSVYSDNDSNDLSSEYKDWLNANNFEDTEENEKAFLDERNKECDMELKRYLISAKCPYTWTPVFGGYHGKDSVVDSYEPSFIVYNSKNPHKDGECSWEDLKKRALDWCKKYKQDSVYIQAPNEPPVYLDKDGNKVSGHSTLNFKFNDKDEEFYTTTKRKKKIPHRFTADIMWESMRLRSKPSSYNDKMRRSYQGEVWDL